MIRVAVMYPNEEGRRFDFEYYKEKHLPLVRQRLKPLRIEIDRGVPDKDENPSPYLAIAYLVFKKFDDLIEGFNAFGGELVSDVPNYTDIQPVFQVSEMVKI